MQYKYGVPLLKFQKNFNQLTCAHSNLNLEIIRIAEPDNFQNSNERNLKLVNYKRNHLNQ